MSSSSNSRSHSPPERAGRAKRLRFSGSWAPVNRDNDVGFEPDTAESPEESPPVVTRGTLQGRSADETTYARRQPDTMTPKEAAAEMPPSTDYCLRCSKDLRNLKDFKCTRPTQYSKCRECARKRKPCESVPDHFHGRFEKVHRLLREVYLSDIPMPEYEKARASYKTDVEAYLKKTVTPSKSSTRGAISPSQSETNSLLRALVSEVRGLRNDFRVIYKIEPLPEEEVKFHGGAVEDV